MKYTLTRRLLSTICLGLLSALFTLQAQSIEARQPLDYYELKGLLLKHKPTVESVLSLKRFKLVGNKVREGSTIYAFKKENKDVQVLIRIRKSDGLVSEVAWNEESSTLGNLTHDAVKDGFVPVTGNSRYHNRLQKMALFVNYTLAEEEAVPCVLRAID